MAGPFEDSLPSPPGLFPLPPRLILQRIRGAIAVAVPRHARLGDHIDVRIDAAILRIAVTDLEYPGRAARFVDEVVAIGVAGSEGGAISGMQHFFATVGDQRQLALKHPDQFVFMAVPVTLAGPGAGLDDGQIHAELSQTRVACEPLRRLVEARPVEGRRIVALGLHGYCGEGNLFGHKHNCTAQGQAAARAAGQIEALLERRNYSDFGPTQTSLRVSGTLPPAEQSGPHPYPGARAAPEASLVQCWTTD
jgi:hypothetical protein